MGEKTAPASTSPEQSRAKSLPDALAHGTPSPFARVSDPAPSASPGNGNIVEVPLAEVPLAVEKAYFERIIENAPDAISIVDQELRILRINAEFTRLFGFTAAEAAGKLSLIHI